MSSDAVGGTQVAGTWHARRLYDPTCGTLKPWVKENGAAPFLLVAWSVRSATPSRAPMHIWCLAYNSSSYRRTVSHVIGSSTVSSGPACPGAKLSPTIFSKWSTST